MRILVIIAALGAFASCQCVTVRDDRRYRCETNDDCPGSECDQGLCADSPDAGRSDGGVADAGSRDSGTPDAGTPDAGTPDAGTPDAGTPDAGPDAGLPDDAGKPDAGLFCNTWACASGGLRAFDGGVVIDAAPCLHPNSTQFAWYGAVLTPSGVIGIPFNEPSVVRVNTQTLECEVFPIPPDSGTNWVSGVLALDGFVYAAPLTAHRILRIDPRDGSSSLVGPDLEYLSGPPGYSGSVLDATGGIWMVSQYAGPLIRYEPSDGGIWFWTFDAGPQVAGMWGLSRVEVTGRDWLFTTPLVAGVGKVMRIDPVNRTVEYVAEQTYSIDDGGPPLRGQTLRGDGTLICNPFVNSGELVILHPDDAGATATKISAGATVVGFTAAGPDGEVWGLQAIEGVAQRLVPGALEIFDASIPAVNFPWSGVVATPDGIIGIPGDSDVVVRVRLSSGEGRTMRQLMSPYFNKQ